MATAGAFFISKAFFKISSWLEKSIPCLNFPTFPITPLSLICGIIFFFLKNLKIINAYKIFGLI